ETNTRSSEIAWGWVSLVVQDCQADSETIEETTLMQPSTTASLNPAERKANALSFPPGCKTGWKASNMMKYGAEEWSGQKERWVLKLHDQRDPRAVCHTPFLPGSLSDCPGRSLGL
ncbi:mCG144706, partial [Mus musculus]